MAPGELGRVIGRRGRTAQSIRTVVRAAATRDDVERRRRLRRLTWPAAIAAPRLEVGRVAKAHGLRGEVAVELVTDREERAGAGARLWIGREVLEVVASRPHQGRWLVTFDGVADRTAAERLAGRALEAEALDDPEALWVHDLIGTAVVEVDGTQRGTVVAVVANPAHDLLELDSGALVPVVFVVPASGASPRSSRLPGSSTDGLRVR